MNKELENTIKRLEEEVNKQAEIIQWYEKENRYNQEIIIDLSKRILFRYDKKIIPYADYGDREDATLLTLKELQAINQQVNELGWK